MKIVEVNASKKYEVIIDNDLLDKTGEYIRQRAGGRIAAIITDDVVDKLYSQRVQKSLQDNDYHVIKFVFNNGEILTNSELISKQSIVKEEIISLSIESIGSDNISFFSLILLVYFDSLLLHFLDFLFFIFLKNFIKIFSFFKYFSFAFIT